MSHFLNGFQWDAGSFWKQHHGSLLEFPQKYSFCVLLHRIHFSSLEVDVRDNGRNCHQGCGAQSVDQISMFWPQATSCHLITECLSSIVNEECVLCLSYCFSYKCQQYGFLRFTQKKTDPQNFYYSKFSACDVHLMFMFLLVFVQKMLVKMMQELNIQKDFVNRWLANCLITEKRRDHWKRHSKN